MKINELRPKTGNIEMDVNVTEIGDIREFEKSGSKGRVAKATISDETGVCKLTLWNEQVDEVKVGSKIKISNGWADEWKDEIQVSTGKFGKIELLEENVIQPEVNEVPKEDPGITIDDNVTEESIYSDDDEVTFDSDDDII